MNERERRQMEREASWRRAYEQFNTRLSTVTPSSAVDKIDHMMTEGNIVHSVIMIDDSEINTLESACQVTVSGPTLDGRVVVVTLRRTRQVYSGPSGKEYHP